MDDNQITVETYNHIASQYTDVYFNDTKTDVPMIDGFLRLLSPGTTILDVGSGPGQFTKYMMEKGFGVVGIDASNSMVAVAQRKVPDGTFRKMDMRHLDYAHNSFDGILAAYSLIHIPTDQLLKTVRGFYDVLKGDGVLLAVTQKGERDHWVDEPMAPARKTFFNFFTSERIATLLKEAGFRVVTQKEVPTSDAYAMASAIIYTTAKK